MASDPLVVLHRTIAVHRSLEARGIAHAVGGALALAYHVGEARATQDIDLNIWLPKERAAEALAGLPPEVPHDDAVVMAIQRDGQVRIPWPVEVGPPVPLDLFFSEHRLHAVAADRTLWVRMLDADVPILAATDLAVFKALFARPKDWVDLQEIVAEAPPSFDLDEAVSWVAEIVGGEDPRVARLRALRHPPDAPDSSHI